MSSTGQLPELESLRSQVADLARELAERDRAMQARQQGVDGELQNLRKQADLLQTIMEGTAADTGDDFFASLATHLTSTLHMQYAVIGKILDGTPARIRTLAVSSGGHLLDNFEYDLAQAPCGTGLTESFWCFEQDVQALFPNFPPLAAMGVESHSGVSIRNRHGNVVGLIVMMDTKPIASQDRLQALLKIFAPRAAAELHRQQAEHEHRQALHELQNIMETVPDFMFTLDTQGNMVKWNRRVEEVTGYSPEELQHKSALALVPAQEQEHTALAIQRAFTDGKAELEGHLLTKDQRNIPYHWTGAVLKNPQGHIIGITGIGRDVSAQKEAAEALQRQRQHLMEAQALAHLGSWEWDIESGETDWSEEQFRIFGHEPGAVAVTYDTFLAALLPDDHDRVLAAVNDALLGTCPLDLECRIVRPNGDIRVIHMRADVQRDATAHPIRMAGTALDITERKQAEEALRASEERWHLAIHGSNDGILDWNIHTGEIFFSARWKAMRGFADHEVRNHIDEWRSRIHPDDLDRVLQSTDSYLAKQTSAFCEEYRVQRKDGSYMWILDQGSALWADDGTPIRMVGLESDITERKQALLRLAQRESLLRSILAAEPECIKRVAADGTLLQMNEAGLCFIETDSFEEVAGRSVYDLVAPEFLELFRSMHEAVLQGASQQLEFQIVGLKGTRRWMETHAVPLWNPIDRRVEHLAITRDISERKRTEAVRDELLARLKKISSHVPGVVYQFKLRPDGSSCFPYTSERIREIYRVSPEEVREDASKVFAILHPEDYDGVVASITNSAETMQPWQYEYRVKFPDGTVRWLYGNSVPQKEADGSILWHGFITDITERTQAEEALRESEERYRTLVELSPSGVFVFSEGRTVYVNSMAMTILGATAPNDILARSPFEFIHPDYHEDVTNNLRRVLAGEASVHRAERVYLKMDGTPIDVQVEAVRITWSGKPAIQGFFSDITERKQGEHRLRLTQFTIDHAVEAIYWIDPHANIVDVNEAAREMLGYSKEDLCAMTVHDLNPDFQADMWPAFWAETKQRGTATIETRHRAKDGRIVPVEVHVSLLSYGENEYHCAFVRNITERKRTDDALRASEERFRTVVESSANGLVMVDGDGRIVLLNRQIEQLFGYRREALIGRPIEVLIPPRFRMHHPSLRAAYQKTPETMMPIRGRNLHGMRQDGGEFPVEIELNPIETGNGPMTLASVMDLTERKRAEDKQKQLLAELTESQKHFEQIFHWTPSAVAISTLAEGRFLDVNDRLVQLTGYSREELIGHTTAELQLWADPLELARVIQEILQQRSPHNEEGLLRTKSGELRTIMVSVDRIQVKATPCLIYVAHDITERKQAEIVQARQYEALQAIFRMTVALSRASSLEELYEQGIDGVQRALKVDRASILLFNEDGVMRFKASRGLSEEYKMALEGHSPWSRETVNPQPMLVEDVVADPSVAPYRKIFVGEGIAALGFIPLVSAEGLLGKFMLYYDTPHQFTEEEIQIAQTIASHVALMIQRKRAVETLRHSERQLRTVLDSLPIGVWFTDRTGKTLLANPAAKQIWSNIRHVGLQTQDNPSGWWETLDPVTEPHRWALSHALTTGEASLNETLDLEDVDGRRKTIRNTTVPVKDESGTTIGAVILNEDLTDLRRIQEALKLTQFSVDHAVEAFFWIGPDANILHVNEAACRMLEYTSDELTNMTVHDIDPNFPLEAWAAHWEELKQKGALTFESKHWSRTGRVLDTEVTVNYLQYEGSEYNCAIIRDIGERKQAEEALRQSEERFRLLVEGAPLGITLLDEHFCYVKVNQAFCNLVGYREEEILGQTSALFIHSDDRTSNLAVAAEANRGERASYRLEKRYIRKNKQPIWVTVNATSLPLRGNTDHHVVAIIEDITERKRLAEREASRIRQLKKLSELSMTLSGDPAVVFDQVVRIIGELFNIQVVCLSEIVGEELHFKSVYIDGQILRSEEHCPLAITPCATVAQAKDMRIFDRVMERFPQATFLKDHEAHMYCGFPALDSHGTVVAVTCLLDNNLHEFAEEEHELLRIIGQRIAVEIERSRHISEKQQAEDALRQNHALLSAIMDATMDIVFVKDLEGRYLHMNPAGARVVGLPPQEIIGKDDDAIFPADLAACCKEADRQILSTRSAQTVEESTMAGGRRITYLTTKAPYRDAAGHMIGIIGVAHDISQIKQSEEDLRRSHALIRQIIDTDPNFIFAKDREGHFTLVNKAVAEAYGTSVERLIGKTDADFSSNTRELEFFRKKDLEVLNSLREQFIAEEMFTDSTGRTRWLQTVKRPILDESGQATMVLGASTDITERKRIEEALRQRERDLRTALDERERISQDLHDGILQSLYAVGLGLEACKPLMTQRHYKKAAASMDRAIGQLNHVMSEVRNFIAGLESQILQGSTFPMALRTMVLTLTADHPIPCTLTIDESLANTFSTEQALHLLNVVREALSNSLRHAGATKTTVSLKSLSRSIRLTIADNGRGFNPASMHGAGHGLTNMEARARKVGGRIAIRSVPQQGTRITIDLPKETRHAESESEHGSTAARR